MIKRRTKCAPSMSPARGRFHTFDLDTTVDSKSARYYIESYGQGRVDDPQLHRVKEILKLLEGIKC